MSDKGTVVLAIMEMLEGTEGNYTFAGMPIDNETALRYRDIAAVCDEGRDPGWADLEVAA